MSTPRLTGILCSKSHFSALHHLLQPRYIFQSRFQHSPPQIKPYSNPKTASAPPSKGFFQILDDLGATSRLAKIILITSFTIVGTMETVFYARVLWAKFGPQADKCGVVEDE